MTKTEAKKRIEKMKKVISYHRYLYHVLDKPEISDAALDSLKHELKKLEDEYPEFITSDSPTQRVGGKPLDKFNKITHKKRMLSLEDAFSEEELQDWEKRLKNKFQVPSSKFQDFNYFAELKVDGFAISLLYKKGILVGAATRGDGRIGEDVTQNIKTINSIPLKLEVHFSQGLTLGKEIKSKIEKGEIEIRGEVYMTKKDFEKVNKDRAKQGLPVYANPRNTAAGSIRQLDPRVAASRKLKFLAYSVPTDLGQKNHQEEHQIAESLGFRVGESNFCKNVKDIVNFWNNINKKREKLSYQIDGIVVNVNDNKLFDKLGIVGKAPRGAIALKFAAEESTTIVKNIVVQVGRTGALTPVAVLEPVNIGGTTVTRATLHNEDEIKRLDVRIGDTVIVQRAGDVIPDIVEVIKKLRTGKEKKFKMPNRCPVCDSKVVRPENEAVHRCANKNCGAQQRERLAHFVSRKGFNIDGLGPKIINQLMDEGLVSNPADLYSLTEGDLIPLERFAKKSAENLIKSIHQSKKISLSKFVFALGIRHTGEETAIALAQYFGDIEKIKRASQEQLANIPDVGPVVAKSIFEWFNDKVDQEVLDRLLNNIEIEKVKTVKKVLAGKTFVLTGELGSLTRDEAKEKIRSLGGDISGSVSKNTNYVVAGENPGSKYDKAKKLDVKIVSEKDFLKLLK